MLLTDKEAPLWARQLIAVAVLLGVLILTAIGIFIWNNTHTPTTQTPPTPTPSATPASDPNESLCGLAPGPVEPAAGAPATDWQLKGGYAYPTSRSLGPGTTTNGVGSCFAHSTKGALLAAGTYNTDLMTVDRANVGDFMSRVDGSREQVSRLRRLLHSGAQEGLPHLQLAGFHVIDATADQVTLDLLLKADDGNHAAVPMTMVWRDGDWRYRLSAQTVGRGVPDPFGADGFTEWQGIA